MKPVPNGYLLVTNPDFVLTSDCKYYFSSWDNKDYQNWETVHHLDLINKKYGAVKSKFLNENNNELFVAFPVSEYLNTDVEQAVPSKKNETPQIPDGYSVVSDKSYLIKANDLMYLVSWENAYGWKPIKSESMINKTFGSQQRRFKDNGDLLFVLKKDPYKPKYPTDKPYPFGF